MDKSEKTLKDKQIKSFVLRKGKMSKGQKNAYDQYYQKYCISYNQGEYINRLPAVKTKPIVIEIGFGMGDATADIALMNPDTFYIGIEVHKPGIGKLLNYIENRKIENIRIIPHDAVEVLQHMIAPSSLDGAHVFFPDPWPKKRHHKRRLLKPAFLDLLGSRLKNGAYAYVVTDWEDYAKEILNNFNKSSIFHNEHKGYCPPVSWRPRTKFEGKGISKQHSIFEIMCIKE